MASGIIKAGGKQRYFVRSAAIFHWKETGKYEGVLLLANRYCSGAERFWSEIRIWGENRDMVRKQLKQIGRLWPPKEDLHILDLEEPDKK